MGRISAWAKFPPFFHPNSCYIKTYTEDIFFDVSWKKIFVLIVSPLEADIPEFYICLKTTSGKEEIVTFTECTKTLLCILMRDDSKQLSLFSSSCGELSNIMLLSLILSPASLNSFPLLCWKADRNRVSDLKVYIHSSISHTVKQRSLNCLSPNSLQDCQHSACCRLWRSDRLQYGDARSVSSPILTYLSKMVLNSRMNICFGPLKSAASIIHMPVPFRSVPLVAGHWGVKGWIADKIEILHGMCLETEWWMDRQVGKVSHSGEHLTLCQDFLGSIFLFYVVVPWQLGETTWKLFLLRLWTSPVGPHPPFGTASCSSTSFTCLQGPRGNISRQVTCMK